MPSWTRLRSVAICHEDWQSTEPHPEEERETTRLHLGLWLPLAQLRPLPNEKNVGRLPMQATYSAHPAHAMTWLKVSPVEILPG